MKVKSDHRSKTISASIEALPIHSSPLSTTTVHMNFIYISQCKISYLKYFDGASLNCRYSLKSMPQKKMKIKYSSILGSILEVETQTRHRRKIKTI